MSIPHHDDAEEIGEIIGELYLRNPKLFIIMFFFYLYLLWSILLNI